ncbi:MAG: hypothetical protein V1928_04310 [Parcubacteria group bacterium]
MKTLIAVLAFLIALNVGAAYAQNIAVSLGQIEEFYDQDDPNISQVKNSSVLRRDPSANLHGLEYSGVRFQFNDGEYFEFGAGRSILWLGGWNSDPREMSPIMSLQYIFVGEETEALFNVQFWSWPNAGLSGAGNIFWKLNKHLSFGFVGEAGSEFSNGKYFASIGPAVSATLTGWFKLSAGLAYRTGINGNICFTSALIWIFSLPV